MLHLKLASTGSLLGSAQCPAVFDGVRRCLRTCCWAVTLPALAAAVKNIQSRSCKGIFPHLWAPGRLIYFFPPHSPLAILRPSDGLHLKSSHASCKHRCALLNICPSARIKYPSPCQQHEENRQAHRENINQKPLLQGRILLDILARLNPQRAPLEVHQSCWAPAAGASCSPTGLKYVQARWFHPTHTSLSAWGRVPGWPRACSGATAPEPGVMGLISSLATDFLCGLGQIIRCKARSHSADILREPWFGRWTSCIYLWGEDVLLLAPVETQAPAPRVRRRTHALRFCKRLGARLGGERWSVHVYAGLHPPLVCKWQHLWESNPHRCERLWNESIITYVLRNAHLCGSL